MHFKIETNELKKALEIVNHATSVITTTPILWNILIKVNYKNIILVANNLDIAIEYYFWKFRNNFRMRFLYKF